MNFKLGFGVAIGIRVALVFYGQWQDANMTVKYTDVDYAVYTDASRAMMEGDTPFARTTYRYTPLLAFILLPNVYLHEIFGKILFIIADLLIGVLLYRLLRLRNVSYADSIKYTCVWLWHPFSINVSTRGNADAIIGFLVLWSLYLLYKKQIVASAIIYGLAVHFKIYPIVYALAILVFLNDDFVGKPAGWLNRDRVVFSLVSGGCFLAVTGVCYYYYGYQFLYETYLYHFVRTDNRHNFSVYFYDLYLRYNTPSGFGVGLFAFVPQLSALITVSLVFGRDLSFCVFILTMIFVTFNKVCTAQYFVWYTSLLPLVLPASTLTRKHYIGIIVAWFGAELNWLYWAYYLEMEGFNTFFQIWIAGLLFFMVNVGIILTFIRSHVFQPLFHKDKLIRHT